MQDKVFMNLCRWHWMGVYFLLLLFNHQDILSL